jgi:hypothetical protein
MWTCVEAPASAAEAAAAVRSAVYFARGTVPYVWVVSRQTSFTVRPITKDFAYKPTVGDWSIVTVDDYIINWIDDDMVSRLAPVGERETPPSVEIAQPIDI